MHRFHKYTYFCIVNHIILNFLCLSVDSLAGFKVIYVRIKTYLSIIHLISLKLRTYDCLLMSHANKLQHFI